MSSLAEDGPDDVDSGYGIPSQGTAGARFSVSLFRIFIARCMSGFECVSDFFVIKFISVLVISSTLVIYLNTTKYGNHFFVGGGSLVKYVS